jgi:hypothetical protein
MNGRLDDTSTPNTIYVGTTRSGALTSESLWLIKRITNDAGGNYLYHEHNTSGDYTVKWDDRTTEVYA